MSILANQEKSVEDINSVFNTNKDRNPSIYCDVKAVASKDVIPFEKGSKFGFRLKKESELTKAMTKNKKLMVDFERDTILNRARNQAVSTLKNLEKLEKLKKA
jgi:hypothetical protein